MLEMATALNPFCGGLLLQYALELYSLFYGTLIP